MSVWKHLVRGGVSIHFVPGRHLELITPDYMPTMAKALKDALEQARKKEDSIQFPDRRTPANAVS